MTRDYKVVILCGGKGMRMRPHTETIPKPLVPVGEKPIVWHVMKLYSHYGFHDFILALGHRGNQIVNYFVHYREKNCDFTLHYRDGTKTFHTSLSPDEREWNITFAHTGLETETGGRIRRVAPYIQDDYFLATYADGLSDIDISAVLERHLSSGLAATMTAVNLPTDYGLVKTSSGVATSFREKPRADDLINAGFFVFSRKMFDFLGEDDCVLEQEPLRRMVEERQVNVYHHEGFWHSMDTPKDHEELSRLWNQKRAPWKVWND